MGFLPGMQAERSGGFGARWALGLGCAVHRESGELMNRFFIQTALLVMVLPAAAVATPDLSGTWQGEDKSRHVLKISKSPNGYRGNFYNLGEEAYGATRNGNTISAFKLDRQSVQFSLDNTEGIFDGKLAEDNKTITGTWKPAFGPSHPLNLSRATETTKWVIDPSPHKSQRVAVQPGVKLEVLDWSGNGPPIIFLSGLGNTAHEFDNLAPKFSDKHHVYAITRRGFGVSSTPPLSDENYDADRLGDDVLAVIDALKLDHPVLAGHSVAGEELSSVGTRHPEKIAGLIYLDALYQYAFYDPSYASLEVEVSAVKRDLGRIFEADGSSVQTLALVADIQAALPNLQKALQGTADAYAGQPDSAPMSKPNDMAGDRIFANTRKYGVVKVPVLAILAMPKQCPGGCDNPLQQKIMAGDAARAELYEKQAPSARVVRLPHASHYVWRSNEADVLREMNAFMDGLH
jgi:non-heme chloroperoxidase